MDEIRVAIKSHDDRRVVADFIPKLAKQDNEKFGIGIIMLDGTTYSSGDSEEPFSIQSISKVFALKMALGKVWDKMWKPVGREPSGSALNLMV